MGYIRHNAIVVTSWDQDRLIRAATHAKSLGLPVIGPGGEVTNGYRSILVGPDGSKEGWEESANADAARDAFAEWMGGECYEDGSSSLHWIEVEYGGDDPERAEIVRHYTGAPAAVPAGDHAKDGDDGKERG